MSLGNAFRARWRGSGSPAGFNGWLLLQPLSPYSRRRRQRVRRGWGMAGRAPLARTGVGFAPSILFDSQLLFTDSARPLRNLQTGYLDRLTLP